MPPKSSFYTCKYCGRTEWFRDDDDAQANDWQRLITPLTGTHWACYEKSCLAKQNDRWHQIEESLERHHPEIQKEFVIKGPEYGRRAQDGT